jgi:hypothetical protein
MFVAFAISMPSALGRRKQFAPNIVGPTAAFARLGSLLAASFTPLGSSVMLPCRTLRLPGIDSFSAIQIWRQIPKKSSQQNRNLDGSCPASNLLIRRPERHPVPKRTYECEYPPCHNIGKLCTVDAFGEGRRLTLKLCDEHEKKVRAPLREKAIIDWLVSILWP